MATTYLAHHGILGQKWGVRRGDNYPLEENEHSAAEKKAGWRQSLEGHFKKKKEEKKKNEGSADHQEYERLKKVKLKDMSDDELERFTRRRELEEKYNQKGESAVSKMLTEAGAKTLSNVATVAAISVGTYFVAKKLNITPEKITKGIMEGAGKVAGTVAKEAVKGGANLGKMASEAAKSAGHEARKNIARSNMARSYVKAVDSLLGKKRR